MGIKTKFRNYLFRKRKLKILQTENVVNSHKYINTNKSIVFLSNVFPTHDKDSGSNRLKEIILQCKNLHYNCIICVDKTFEDNLYVQFYKDRGCIVYVENKKYKTIINFLKSVPKIDYYWYNGAETYNNYFETTKKISPSAIKIYDMVDIHFLRIKRALDLNKNIKSLQKSFRKFYKIETIDSKKADIVVAISEKENMVMQKYLENSKVITISNIHYPKIEFCDRKKFTERKDILFIGSVHEPNIDAIDYLFCEIMPFVWRALPEMRVNVIGNVSEKVDADKYPQFNFTGFVPDITSFFQENKLMVAPLRYGAGVKGKIGQAFEYYLPVVTTSIGAEGMKIKNGKNAMVENDSEKFAKAIIEVYTNERIWDKLSNNSNDSLKPFSIENNFQNIKIFKKNSFHENF